MFRPQLWLLVSSFECLVLTRTRAPGRLTAARLHTSLQYITQSMDLRRQVWGLVYVLVVEYMS